MIYNRLKISNLDINWLKKFSFGGGSMAEMIECSRCNKHTKERYIRVVNDKFVCVDCLLNEMGGTSE